MYGDCVFIKQICKRIINTFLTIELWDQVSRRFKWDILHYTAVHMQENTHIIIIIVKRRINTLTLLENWKKAMEPDGDNYINCDWCFWYSNKRIIKGTRWLGSWWPSGDHPNDSIIENGQNTEKSPGDLGRIAITQTPVKDHQPTLMWTTLKE